MIHIKARRPGSKGNEWLLIKKHDDAVVEGYNIDGYDSSVLTKRTMAQIAGDSGSDEWTSSRPAARKGAKNAWLNASLAKLDKQKRASKKAADSESSISKGTAAKPSALKKKKRLAS